MKPVSSHLARLTRVLGGCLIFAALAQAPDNPPRGREIAERWLDWNKLGPLAQQHQSLIAADVKADTRKLDSLDAFTKGVTVDTEVIGSRGPRRGISLKSFVEQRRAYLLNHPAVKQTRTL